MNYRDNAEHCVFCSPDRCLIQENDHAYAVLDKYPLTEGHALVIPKRHIQRVEETTLEELNDLFGLVRSAMSKIESEIGKKPDGFNIGINDGEYAGQTIGHLHVHVIPRFKGDVEDPRGGVRWVLPSKAKYW